MGGVEEIYRNIDANLDDHLRRVRDFLRQPSISQTGEGVRECAELLARHLRELGCSSVRLVDEDYISPIVYARYDAGADRTLIIYMMYDVQPVEPHLWSVPPFEAAVVEMPPFRRVIMARGATNTKGPLMAFINACRSIIEVAGELPVNLIFVAEGEEERTSVSLREKFVPKYADELREADGVFFPMLGQDRNGLAHVRGGSEGIVYLELETSGAGWGRGPQEFGIHGGMMRIVDNPAWRHIKMLSTLVEDAGGARIAIEGWYDDVEPPSERDLELIREAAKYYDPENIKKIYRVARFIGDVEDPEKLLEMMLFGTSFCIDGIWAGWTGEGTKTLLPHKATSKHNIRFVPNQRMDDLLQKLRRHLDRHGFRDVEIRVLGGYTWARADYDSDVARALAGTYDYFGVKYVLYPPVSSGCFMPAWPACAFAREPLSLPVAVGGLGHGGRAHSPDEYMVLDPVEAKHGTVHGLSGCEKSFVKVLYEFAGMRGSERRGRGT